MHFPGRVLLVFRSPMPGFHPFSVPLAGPPSLPSPRSSTRFNYQLFRVSQEFALAPPPLPRRQWFLSYASLYSVFLLRPLPRGPVGHIRARFRRVYIKFARAYKYTRPHRGSGNLVMLRSLAPFLDFLSPLSLLPSFTEYLLLFASHTDTKYATATTQHRTGIDACWFSVATASRQIDRHL